MPNKNANKFLGSIKTRDASVSNLQDLAQKNPGYDALQLAVDKLSNAFTGQLDELVARGRDEYWNDQMLQKAVEELVEKQLKDIVYKDSNDYKIIVASLLSPKDFMRVSKFIVGGHFLLVSTSSPYYTVYSDFGVRRMIFLVMAPRSVRQSVVVVVAVFGGRQSIHD